MIGPSGQTEPRLRPVGVAGALDRRAKRQRQHLTAAVIRFSPHLQSVFLLSIMNFPLVVASSVDTYRWRGLFYWLGRWA